MLQVHTLRSVRSPVGTPQNRRKKVTRCPVNRVNKANRAQLAFPDMLDHTESKRKLRLTAVASKVRAGVSRSIAAGQWRWRWDLNPRMSCPITRFRGVRPRPLGDSTAAEPT